MATCPTCRRHYPDDVTTCEVDGATLLADSSFAAEDKELAAGTMVGEYAIEGKIGEGGFGSVYRAVHPVIGKTAAVKVLNRQFSSNPEIVSRFVAEARAVNQIRHKNIIDVFAFGALPDGRQFYVMELLEGMTLDRHVKRRGRLQPEEAIPILRGVARALDAAHAAGIAHRDLKPENIYLVFDEDGGVSAKLLDFGIAKLMGDSSRGHKTQTGVPIGTPYFMSPEQCRGDKIDHRTDIYSFGVVVHELLTGRLPFVADSFMQVMMLHASSPPPRVSEHCPELSPALDVPVLRMLEKDPSKRPDSIGAALEELAAAAKSAGHAVEVMSRSGARSARSSGGQTPHELDAIGSASTVIQASTGSSTLSASEKVASIPPRRRAVFVSVAIAALVAIVLTVGLVARKGKRAARELGEQGAGADRGAAAARVRDNSAPAPKTAAPAASKALGAPTEEIELTFDATPKDAEVYLGEVKLGAASGPIRVARGNEKLTLTLKATGYQPKEVEVTPSADGKVEVKLRRVQGAAPRGARGKVSKDLEF
jgi:eukaryotic-like serine/threonine-protein kinase